MSEQKSILAKLNSLRDRPSMYGNPENVESLAKNLTHIYLKLLREDWGWQKTEDLWTLVAQEISARNQFSQIIYESHAYRSVKWGKRELPTRNTIVEVYRRIWDELRPQCVSFPRTSSWIDYLLDRSDKLGSPDNCDLVLWSLISVACQDYMVQFKQYFVNECVLVRGTAHRGLQDLNTNDDWQWVPRPAHIDAENYDMVGRGIFEIIQQLKTQGAE